MARFIGLDIGSFSIKVVSLSKKGGSYRLEAIGIVLNPHGDRPGDDEASQNKVSEAVKKLLSDVKLSGSKAALALPESQVYTKVIEMPALTDSELASAIHWEAEQYIPVPIDQVNIDYEVISRPQKSEVGDKMEVFLVAAPKKVVSRLSGFAGKCGVEVVSLETEMVAVSRAMIRDDEAATPTMLVHIGASSTDVSVVVGGMLVLTHSIESGGVALTRTLTNELGMEFAQAEEYKRSYGLDPSQLEGKVGESIRPHIDRSVVDMKKTVQYYNANHQEVPIKRVVLSGGSALLPGLVSYMAQFLGMEVVLGNAFAQVEPSSKASIPNDTVSFATAVGLAMREL
jgi:type IV pilus assembly protein PilM